MHSTRPVSRGSTVPLRALVATALALGLVLAIATTAWAAPTVSIDSGPAGPTSDTMPLFGFTVDVSATTVECAIAADQATPVYGPCSGLTTHAPAAPLAPDGNYVFWIRATDGVEETVRTRSFSVDTVASLSIVSGPAGPTSDTMPLFGFTAELGATVECAIAADQATPVYGPCSGLTTHAPAAPLAPDGDYVFWIRATDTLGNQTELSQGFTVDTVVPTVNVVSGPSGPTNVRTPSFGFTAEAGARVACSIDQGTYGACTSGTTHTVGTPLSEGAHTFQVRATDAAGNHAEASRSFSVDTVAPTVGVVSGPTVTSADTPSFGFTAEAGATVQCAIDPANQGSPAYGSCSGAGTHAPAAPLADGNYVFRVRARDAAGNQATASRAFTVDSSVPSLSIDSGPRGPTNDAAPSFGFTAEAGASVECSVDQGTPAYGSCTSATTHVVGSPLPEGTYTFRVRATDDARNQARDSRTFTVDTTPPSLSIGFGPSGTMSDTTPLFGFSAEAGATVECSIDQGAPAYGPCASATTDAAVAPLADGDYVFRVRATDPAGNQTVATRAFTVDTVPDAPGPGSPRPDPTPPVTPPVTPSPSELQMLSPFPLVRISGTLTSTGARIRLLSVRASRGTLVRVTVSPACSRRRPSSRRCRVVQAAGTVGGHDVISFRGLARAYRSGTVIVVRVWRADRIGKYTRFTIVRGKAPRRVDKCLVPEATHGSRCPNV